MGGVKSSINISLLKNLVIFFPAYLFFLSYLHLQFYYNIVFDIPVFKYLSINTFILQSVKYIGMASLTLLGVIILKIFPKIESGIRSHLKTTGSNSLERAFFYIWVLFIIIFSILIVFSGYKNIIQALIFIIIIISIMLFGMQKSFKVFKNLHPNLIFLIALAFIVLPSFIIQVSYLNGLKVKDNIQYSYIAGSDLKDYQTDERIKIIGKVDEYFFLQPVSNDSSIMVRKYSDIKTLDIQQFKKELVWSF